jgi:MGT family glycosyltransferase
MANSGAKAKKSTKRRAALKKKAAPKKTATKKKAVTKKKVAAKKTVAKKAARKAATAKRSARARTAPPKPRTKPKAAKPAARPKPRPTPPPARPAAARVAAKTIVLYPEAAFGPALNCVGIAQQLKAMGHNPVFVCDRGFKGVFEKYGFEENLVDMSGGMSDEEIANFWANFIAGHLPHFRLSPIEQLPTYVVPVWEAIVDSAIISHEGLMAHLQRLKPDVVCVDNVILFPAIKAYGKPWIRVISCSENEIPDPEVPPHLSGCSAGDYACYEAFELRFLDLIRPTHDRFNEFLAKVGHEPYPLGQFFETSPYMNLLLYPRQLRFKRAHPLDPARFQYLEGCVRKEDGYAVPKFAANAGKPLIYVSFGSLGAADVDLYKRMIALFGTLPYRFLMNVGDYIDQYTDVPGNVHLDKWYPQPAVIPQVDLFIHHGGNNSFNEALYFGKPAIIMPYCWDGLDNATRIDDTGYGAKLPRYTWTDDQMWSTIDRLLTDKAMKARLAEVSRSMQAAHGAEKAARIIGEIAMRGG